MEDSISIPQEVFENFPYEVRHNVGLEPAEGLGVLLVVDGGEWIETVDWLDAPARIRQLRPCRLIVQWAHMCDEMVHRTLREVEDEDGVYFSVSLVG